MKQTKTQLGALFIFLFAATCLQAQEAVTTAGGNAMGSGGSSAFTIGQLVYTTSTGTTGTVAQGVQQPYEISIIDGVEEAKEIALSTMVYPNPATDFLMLKVANYSVENLYYSLTDINGQLLICKKIAGNETAVEMKNYANAIYFLKVIQGEKEVKSFKIVKN